VKRKLIFGLMAVPIVVLLFIGLAVSWLTMTEKGTRWVINQALSYAPGNASIQTINGRLIGPLDLNNVSYDDNELRILVKQLKLEWSPLMLLQKKADIILLEIDGLDVTLPPADPNTEAPSNAPFELSSIVLPDIVLPVDLHLNDIAVKNMNIRQGSDTVLALHEAVLQGAMQQDQVELQLLGVHAADYQAELTGRLQTSQQYPHNLTVNWQYNVPDYPDMSGRGVIQGDSKQLTLNHWLQKPFVADFDAQMKNLFTELQWQAGLTIKDFNAQLIDPKFPAFKTDVSLVASGTSAALQSHLALNGEMAEIGAFDAEVKMRRLENEDISVDVLSLNIPETNTTVNGHGEWLANGTENPIKASLKWMNVSWPLQGTPMVRSDSGRVSVNGTLEDYTAQADVKIRGEQVPPGYWHLNVSGSDNEATLTSLRAETLNGVVKGHGKISWKPELTWQATIEGDKLDPGAQWPEWPGKIAFGVNSDGRYINDNLAANVQVTDGAGTLRGYPFVAQMQAKLHNGQVDIDQLIVQSGESHLSAQGHAGETIDLSVLVEVPDFAQLYPDAKGALSIVADARGTQTDPQVNVTVNGKALAFQDYNVASVMAKVSGDVMNWNAAQLQLEANKVDLANVNISTLSASASGSNGKHNAQILADTSEGKLALMLKGGFDTVAGSSNVLPGAVLPSTTLPGTKDAPAWRGTLQRAELLSKQFGSWRLQQAGDLRIAHTAKKIGPLCWAADGSTLCLNAKQLAQTWSGDIAVRKLALALFSPYLPPSLLVDGQINLDANAIYEAERPLQAKVDITLPRGNIDYQLGEGVHQSWPYQQGKVTAVLDHRGIRSNLGINFVNGDELSAKLHLPEADVMALNPEKQALSASGTISIGDLSIVEALVPTIENANGKIKLSTTVGGTLGQPQLKLDGALSEGAITIPNLNITIAEVQATLSSDNSQVLRYEASARSGEGDISIQGLTQLDPGKQWSSEIAIKGKSFEVARIPEARVEISPDIVIKTQGNDIHVDGEVYVPVANLQPKDVSSAVSVSDDVVVIGGTQPPEEKMQILAKIKVILGDRVRFYGFGFDGQFGGDITIIEKPGKPTSANGELKVIEGRYRAYGQRLDINDGRVFFSGGPVTNPGLDMRAIRAVPDIIVGLSILGSVKSPKIELFSEPPMDQAEILSYLVLGRSMEGASQEDGQAMAGAALALGLAGGDTLARRIGQQFGFDELRIDTSENDGSSLLLGRYLSPRLYLSYSVGLINAINTIHLRYDLTQRLQLIGESGDTHGADLLYTIKR